MVWLSSKPRLTRFSPSPLNISAPLSKRSSTTFQPKPMPAGPNISVAFMIIAVPFRLVICWPPTFASLVYWVFVV
ncbi:hypothetical protein D3C79_1046770 [compost metagenome]